MGASVASAMYETYISGIIFVPKVCRRRGTAGMIDFDNKVLSHPMGDHRFVSRLMNPGNVPVPAPSKSLGELHSTSGKLTP
jgi:hypothetical protein